MLATISMNAVEYRGQLKVELAPEPEVREYLRRWICFT
jgi:hypothetical protein